MNAKLSIEKIGQHNAVVYLKNGSRIILLEDSISASAQHRLAYREMARLITEHAALEAVAEAARKASIEFQGVNPLKGLKTIRDALANLAAIRGQKAEGGN